MSKKDNTDNEDLSGAVTDDWQIGEIQVANDDGSGDDDVVNIDEYEDEDTDQTEKRRKALASSGNNIDAILEGNKSDTDDFLSAIPDDPEEEIWDSA